MKRPKLIGIGLPVLFAAVMAFPQTSWADHGQGKGKGNDKKADKADKRGGAPDQRVYAVERGHGRDDKGREVIVRHEPERGAVRDSVREHVVAREAPRDAWRDHDRYRTVVREYYVRNHNALPPGLARRESLPPGLRKQLYERGHLPPGLEKRMVVMPVYIERELPPLPPYYYRAVCGDDVLVIDRRSRVIVSIMPNIFVDLRF